MVIKAINLLRKGGIITDSTVLPTKGHYGYFVRDMLGNIAPEYRGSRAADTAAYALRRMKRETKVERTAAHPKSAPEEFSKMRARADSITGGGATFPEKLRHRGRLATRIYSTNI